MGNTASEFRRGQSEGCDTSSKNLSFDRQTDPQDWDVPALCNADSHDLGDEYDDSQDMIGEYADSQDPEDALHCSRKGNSDPSSDLDGNFEFDSPTSSNLDCPLSGSWRQYLGDVIPQPRAAIEQRRLSIQESILVIFDLETTGLGNRAEICQIAASYKNDKFDVFMVPERHFHPDASAVHGMTKIGKRLYRHGQPVEAVSVPTGLKLFLEWLKSLPSTVILAAHNAMFDSRVFVRSLRQHDRLCLGNLPIAGFLDTLPLMRVVYPGLNSYKQENLVGEILKISYESHNASEDVRSLQALVNKAMLSGINFSAFTFDVDYVRFLLKRAKWVRTFEPLTQGKYLSTNLATKAAGSGLQFEHLALAYDRMGASGIECVLSELFQGKPRVSKNRNVISKVVSYFEVQSREDMGF